MQSMPASTASKVPYLVILLLDVLLCILVRVYGKEAGDKFGLCENELYQYVCNVQGENAKHQSI